MANPAMLAGILRKLVRINAALGTSVADNLAADLAVADAVADTLSASIGAGNLTDDIETARVDALTKTQA